MRAPAYMRSLARGRRGRGAPAPPRSCPGNSDCGRRAGKAPTAAGRMRSLRRRVGGERHLPFLPFVPRPSRRDGLSLPALASAFVWRRPPRSPWRSVPLSPAGVRAAGSSARPRRPLARPSSCAEGRREAPAPPASAGTLGTFLPAGETRRESVLPRRPRVGISSPAGPAPCEAGGRPVVPAAGRGNGRRGGGPGPRPCQGGLALALRGASNGCCGDGLLGCPGSQLGPR